MCICHSILECCVTFSGVKWSIRSFVLFMETRRNYKVSICKTFEQDLGIVHTGV